MAVETNSFPTLLGLVKAGAGIGFMAELDTMIEAARGSIVFRPLAESSAPVPRLCLTVKAERTLPFATSIALKRLSEAMQQLVDEMQGLPLPDKIPPPPLDRCSQINGP